MDVRFSSGLCKPFSSNYWRLKVRILALILLKALSEFARIFERKIGRMYRRPLYGLLKSRLEEPRKFIQVLVGSRQVGKTTLLSQLLAEIQMPHHSVSATPPFQPITWSCWMQQASWLI